MTPKKNPYIFACILLFFLGGCIPQRQGYLLSPENGNSIPYHAMPMKSDSLKSVIYAGAVFTLGNANDRLADNLHAFQVNAHRSHDFGIFQAYYGLNLTLGSYQVTDFYNFRTGYPWMRPDDSLNHTPASNHGFGTYGFTGGINVVKVHDHLRKSRQSEWRILGLETSLQNEFGSYADYRQKLPDSAMNIIFRKHFSAYLGLYTEWVWSGRNKIEYGLKMAFGTDLNPGTAYSNYYARSILPLYTYSIAMHIKQKRFIGFIQTNFGSYAEGVQLGFTYILAKSTAR